MKVLVACEFSGTVRDAFARNGHESWSCDLLPCDTAAWSRVVFSADCGEDGYCPNHPDKDFADCSCLGPTQDDVEYEERDGELWGRRIVQHFQCDVREVLGNGWDLMVAHPPCTYLSGSGLHWNKRRPERAKLTEDALEFVQLLLDAPIRRIALENPIGCISSRIRKPDQIIQPWQFGHPESKATCLWLKGLPKLIPTDIVPLPESGRWENQTPSGQNKLGPSPDRWKIRSVTYRGIGEAMADQWGTVEAGARSGLLF